MFNRGKFSEFARRRCLQLLKERLKTKLKSAKITTNRIKLMMLEMIRAELLLWSGKDVGVVVVNPDVVEDEVKVVEDGVV